MQDEESLVRGLKVQEARPRTQVHTSMKLVRSVVASVYTKGSFGMGESSVQYVILSSETDDAACRVARFMCCTTI